MIKRFLTGKLMLRIMDDPEIRALLTEVGEREDLMLYSDAHGQISADDIKFEDDGRWGFDWSRFPYSK